MNRTLPVKSIQQLGPTVKHLKIYTPRTKTGRKVSSWKWSLEDAHCFVFGIYLFPYFDFPRPVFSVRKLVLWVSKAYPYMRREMRRNTLVRGLKMTLNPRRIYGCVSRKQVDNQETELIYDDLQNWAVLHLTLFTWKRVRRRLCTCLNFIIYAKAVTVDISIMQLSISHSVRT
jgi:hypothetical protein